MNKRFSTLLAAFVAFGVSAFAVPATAATPVGSAGLSTTPQPTTSVVDGEYYLLGTAANNVLSIQKTTNGKKDSLVIGTIPTDQKTALWTIKKTETTALGDYYSFTNVSTGQVLSLDTKSNGTIVGGKFATFGWNPTAASPFTHIKAGVKYALTAGATPADSLSLSESATGLDIQAYLPAWKALTAAELNELNGTSFTWTVSGATSQTAAALKSLTSINKKFTAVGTSDDDLDSDDQSFYLKVLGSDKGTKAAYLNVDTVYYTKTGSLIDSTATNGGLTIGIDTLDNYGPKAGKLVESFIFSVWVNTKDSLIIEVGNVPTAAANSTFAATSTVTDGVISLVGFDGTSTALTASAPATISTVYPKVEFGAGTKANLADGTYFIYNQAKDSAYVATIFEYDLDVDTDGETYTFDYSALNSLVKAGQESALVPSTQWVLTTTAGKSVLVNREVTSISSPAQTLYKGENADEYYFGDETIVLKPVVTDGIYVGYKKFAETAAEEKITKVALQFHSAITEGLTAFVYTNDSILKAKNLDKDDSEVLYFNILPTDTIKFGADSLVQVAYKLYIGKDTVGVHYDPNSYNYNYTLKLGKDLTTNSADASFVFRATNVPGKYQILPVAYGGVDGQVNVSGTDALVNISWDMSSMNGLFSLETKGVPEYATVENGHYRISSAANTTLAISINADSIGVLKAVTELKSEPFVEQNFSLFVEEFKADVVKPLYYIVTKQTLDLTEEDDADARFFLTAKGGDLTNSKGSDLFAIKAKRIGQPLSDSLHVYGVKAALDTVIPAKNYSTFAFQKAETEGQYYVQNDKTGKYLAQSNGILFLVASIDDALAFELGAPKELPVSNIKPGDVAEVKVVAVEGGVVITKAAGKKVVVSNILGQTVASTVLTSDNATIAAPKGIVVVAVEGEDAVKAIVK